MKSIHTEVRHSTHSNSWLVVGTELGKKYKIARCEYTIVPNNEIISTMNKSEALEHAQFISNSFNKERHNY